MKWHCQCCGLVSNVDSVMFVFSTGVFFTLMLSLYHVVFVSWEEVMEHEYALRLAKICRPSVADDAAVDKLSLLPTNWSFSHYEQMFI